MIGYIYLIKIYYNKDIVCNIDNFGVYVVFLFRFFSRINILVIINNGL